MTIHQFFIKYLYVYFAKELLINELVIGCFLSALYFFILLNFAYQA